MTHRPRVPVLAMLAAATMITGWLVAGCTRSSGSPSASTSSGTPASPSSQASAPATPAAGGNATTYPVPPSASPSALPSLGSAKNPDGTFTLTAVRRVSPTTVSVEGVFELTHTINFARYTEPGFAYYTDKQGTKRDTWEFSAVTLTAAGDPKIYLPMRTPDDRCVCTQGVVYYSAGPVAVYTFVTAPAAATSVTVQIAGVGTFRNVPVSA